MPKLKQAILLSRILPIMLQMRAVLKVGLQTLVKTNLCKIERLLINQRSLLSTKRPDNSLMKPVKCWRT